MITQVVHLKCIIKPCSAGLTDAAGTLKIIKFRMMEQNKCHFVALNCIEEYSEKCYSVTDHL